MMKKINYFVIIYLTFSFFWKADSLIFLRDENSQNEISSHEGSCSVITCSVGDEVLYGYNHDGHEYLEPYIVFGDHLVFRDGEIYEFGKPMCHTGRMLPEGPRDGYACLTTDGLSFAYNSLSSIEMYIDPLKENYTEVISGYGPVYECSTVEEVIEFYNQYNYFKQDPTPHWSLQSHWADAGGNAIVVGLNQVGNVTITEMNESQYMISTNLNVAYPACCDGPCSDSTWRINTANEMLQNIVEEDSLTVNSIREVLKAISVESTLHSLIFNPKTLDVYAYYRHDFSKVFRFNIEEELSVLSTGEYKLYDLKKMYDNTIGSSGTFIVIGVVCVALAIIIIKTKKTIIEAK